LIDDQVWVTEKSNAAALPSGGGGGGAGWTGLGQRMKTFWLMSGKHPALILFMAFSF